MIHSRRCRSIDLLSSAALRVSAAFVFASSIAQAAPNDNRDGDVVLPPPPAYATPASAMRLPNLPPLGNPNDAGAASTFTPRPAPLNAVAGPTASPAPRATLPAIANPKLESTSPAATLLRSLRQRTGLSDLQEAELQAAQKRLQSGDEAGALHAAQMLATELDKDTRLFIVTDGNNLFSIAGMPQVYANPNLWPLLWWENQPLLMQPTRLRDGMPLKVLAHPSIDQVNLALDYARTHNVLTAPPIDRDLLARSPVR
jgi:hypothetical protein